MGYTHYWRRPRNNAGSAYMYGKLALDAKKIIEKAQEQGIDIAGPHGTDEPMFSEVSFSLNGADNRSTGGQDGSYETFCWEGIPSIQEWRKDQQTTFDFCKTAFRDYDAVVTAILIRAKHIYGSCVEVSSDGNWDNQDKNAIDDYGTWTAGRELYEQTFSEVAECPFDEVSV